MTKLIKYAPVIVVFILFAIFAAVLTWKDKQINELSQENERLTVALAVARHETAQAAAQIETQNAKIEKHNIDMAEAEKRYTAQLAGLKAKNNQTRVEIVKELVADPSCENELNIIKETLQNYLLFDGGGL